VAEYNSTTVMWTVIFEIELSFLGLKISKPVTRLSQHNDSNNTRISECVFAILHTEPDQLMFLFTHYRQKPTVSKLIALKRQHLFYRVFFFISKCYFTSCTIFYGRKIWVHIYKIYCSNSCSIFAMSVRPFLLEQLDKVWKRFNLLAPELFFKF